MFPEKAGGEKGGRDAIGDILIFDDILYGWKEAESEIS